MKDTNFKENQKNKFSPYFIGIFFFTIILFGFFGLVENSQAETIPVVDLSGQPSCEQIDVQRIIYDDSTIAGDTILMPARTCTWSEKVIVAKGITLQGAGIDQTIIKDNVPTGSGQTSKEALLWNITSGTNGGRITGLTFIDENPAYYNYNGIVLISGTVPNFRIDHCKFNTFLNSRGIYVANTTVTGLIDHCIFKDVNGAIMVKPSASTGEELWSQSTFLGGADAIYIEDCVAENNILGVEPFYDGEYGAKVVIRNNNLTKMRILCHGREWQSSNIRLEIYNNIINLSGSTGERVFVYRGGTGIVYGNVATGTWSAWGYFRDYCVCQTNTCNHPFCYSYPCEQQVGRTSGIAFPNQKLEPIYQFNNLYNGTTPAFTIGTNCTSLNPDEADIIQANRDFYDDKDANFNGTVGVGTVDHGARPATCTTGVAWWDGNTLDKCIATNTWMEAYYIPYTYPHPLTGEEVPDTTPPAPPSGLLVR